MKRKTKGDFYSAASFFVLFVLWTVAVKFVDVRPIGPNASSVGFAAVNGLVHSFTGVHMSLYTLTDWLSFVPVGIVAGFAILGFIQLVKSKSILKVDCDILILGCFYAAVMAVYILFEAVVINYRPVLINGILEVSYPSSTTMLVMCIMPTAAMQLKSRIKNEKIRRWIVWLIFVFTVLMVLARLISGVHWFSDIVGGALLSTALVMSYRGLIKIKS